MEYYRYHEFCLCPQGGKLPEDAAQVAEPFSPLVFLVERDPLTSRGWFSIHSLRELTEPESVNLLLPLPEEDSSDAIAKFVQENGASVINTVFARWFEVLRDNWYRHDASLVVHLVGLGNVGGTTAMGLKLLGNDLQEIGVFDYDFNKRLRYEAELNQVLPVRDGERLPPVVIPMEEHLFRCDALLFTAAQAVPEVGAESGKDIRMMQYAANRELLRPYAKRARESGFTGCFMQISDPVDQLSRAVFLMSNQNEQGELDWQGLLPEQVRGFGLGVMHARAIYAAERNCLHTDQLRCYGPHGHGLVIANAPEADYHDDISRHLTHLAETANLDVRSYGYKPYIAPGLSSAAVSVLRALRGEWHDAAVPLGGVYYGCRSRITALGMEQQRESLHPELQARIEESYLQLKEFDAKWAD